MKKHEYIIKLSLLAIFLLSGCKKESNEEIIQASGNIKFEFYHYCDGEPLDFDIRKYVNEAGNEYMVNEIQYFISDVTLYGNGREYLIEAWKDIHYVDSDIESTMKWDVYDDIPAMAYEGIRFTFGICEEKNVTLMYTDPPESLMFWPQYLGGGYHYMKLNGKWLDTNGLERPFDFHLGIGQVYDSQTGEITGFIQNYFTVEVTGASFVVEDGKETIIRLVMNVDRWFKNPHTYDHDEWGGDIMQNQAAMKLGCENGQDVFEVLSFEF